MVVAVVVIVAVPAVFVVAVLWLPVIYLNNEAICRNLDISSTAEKRK